MTLTSILPTLRDSIASPFDHSVWPAGAAPLTDDVTLSAVSMCRYAELCGTPCVCTGSAVIPFSGGIASPSAFTTVVIATVVAVEPGSVRLDALLGEADAVWREARLIGRVSHAYEARYSVDATAGASVTLPGDLRVGDRIAVPWPGYHSVGEVCAQRNAR